MKTIRLLRPDHVGGGIDTYYFGANLLTHILPQNGRQAQIAASKRFHSIRTRCRVTLSNANDFAPLTAVCLCRSPAVGGIAPPGSGETALARSRRKAALRRRDCPLSSQVDKQDMHSPGGRIGRAATGH